MIPERAERKKMLDAFCDEWVTPRNSKRVRRVLTAAFLLLLSAKLAGAPLSWWLVTSPFWGPFVLLAVALIGVGWWLGTDEYEPL